MNADTELVGLSGAGGRWRPVAAGPFALLALALALLPIRPVWLWALLIAVVSASPWVLGAAPEARRRRPRPYWRLSAAGLERIGKGGLSMVRYERDRIDGLAITTGDGMLTVFHRFGRTAVGGLTAMGLEPLALFVTARRLGIPMHVLDGEASDLLDPALDEALRHQGADADVPAAGPLPRDHAAEQRLLDQEAALLAAVHEPPRAKDGDGPARERTEFRLDTPDPLPSRRRVALLGTLTAVLGGVMIVRIAVQGAGGFEARLAAGCWALAAITGVLAARRRLLRAARVRWTITAERLLVRARPGRRRLQDLPSGQVAAVVVGPGLRLDPLSGEPRRAELAALAFGHRMELVARLPAHGLDGFQLAHALDDHGYHVITPGARPPRRPDYGLEGLPDIFAQVPGGRLVVADGGLGWADAAGDVVLKMPEDRIGGIELLTIAGHAWVRLYDTDGDEFFAAPLSALRISRTDLRESARKAGLPVNDAEYDAYLSAAFHSAMSTLTAPEPETRATASLPGAGAAADGASEGAADGSSEGAGPGPREASPASGGLAGEPDFAFTVPDPPSPVTAPGALLDATRRSRVGTYGMSVLLCEAVALIGAVWLGPDLGGFGTTASWSVPAGLLIGLAGYWLYDRNRSQLRVSSAGLAVVTRRGKVEWDLARDRIGGVGIDEAAERLPRLVVWGPSGRVLRQVTFPPDLDELRRACERYGVPWGPPDADLPAPPPPEL
ncbi:hypothetical protein [Actinomadura verrucosospora]|uniref:Uncharacterized protein n=1 Tax=Actinomadura verrucosospora TaxID=46165 RepID=A0A7D4A042_ACTVE|nr:hypothetical protein [Actinomadura verrucosospora]QKG22544.1 hypothetical protein ACTIVE_4184 [Actinomadura verrucosospora]